MQFIKLPGPLRYIPNGAKNIISRDAEILAPHLDVKYHCFCHYRAALKEHLHIAKESVAEKLCSLYGGVTFLVSHLFFQSFQRAKV